ncbi:hypothetical protein SRHO_G00067560 [Serrasalmus rhombeus]
MTHYYMSALTSAVESSFAPVQQPYSLDVEIRPVYFGIERSRMKLTSSPFTTQESRAHACSEVSSGRCSQLADQKINTCLFACGLVFMSTVLRMLRCLFGAVVVSLRPRICQQDRSGAHICATDHLPACLRDQRPASNSVSLCQHFLAGLQGNKRMKRCLTRKGQDKSKLSD